VGRLREQPLKGNAERANAKASGKPATRARRTRPGGEQESGSLKSDSPFALAIEGANDGLWDWDVSSDRVYRSSRVQTILGHEPADAVGTPKDWPALVHPEDKPAYLAAMRALMRGETETFSLKYRVRHVGGGYRWMLDRALARRDTEGRVTRLAGSLTDITDSKRVEDHSRENGLRFSLLVAGVKDYAIFMLDPEGLVVSWNEGAAAIKGYRSDEIIGKSFSSFYTPEDLAVGKPMRLLARARAEGHAEDTGWRLRKNGERFRANVVVTALFDDAGELRGFAKITRDVTDRERVAEALRESEQRFRLLIAGVKDYAICMLDPQGCVVSWNEGAERIIGYRAGEILGKHVSSFYPAEDIAREKPGRDLELASRNGRSEDSGWRLRKDGTRFMANVVLTALYDETGSPRGFAKITRDVTERERAEAELRLYAERLRALSTRLIDLQEIERRHIALELHDEIGQALTALKINLEAMQRVEPEFGRMPRISESVEIVGQLIEEVRDMSLSLRPSILDDFGLMPALRWYTRRQAERSGYVIDLLEAGSVSRASPPIETACFRIAQEALTNIARHAQAKHVKVTIAHSNSKIELAIEDDGVGFDPVEARENLQHGRGHGLLGMQERARLLGGQIEIDAAPGKGTVIKAEFPLSGLSAPPEQAQRRPQGRAKPAVPRPAARPLGLHEDHRE
jgi:PAS domain S-box-containing protein